MKSFLYILITVVAISLGACKTSSLPAEMPDDIRSMVENMDFSIRVSDMAPQRYYSRPVTSVYGIEVKDGWLNSSLPYLGQQQIPTAYSSIPKGLTFKEIIRKSYIEENHKKNRTEITIDVKNEEDSYIYVIYLYYDYKAEIMVRPNKRDFIRFYGDIEQ